MSDDEDSDIEDFRVAVESFRVAVESRAEETWFIDHYDVLQQLYHDFKTIGESLFGTWFYQSGGFHNFVHFVYAHSQLSSKPP